MASTNGSCLSIFHGALFRCGSGLFLQSPLSTFHSVFSPLPTNYIPHALHCVTPLSHPCTPSHCKVPLALPLSPTAARHTFATPPRRAHPRRASRVADTVAPHTTTSADRMQTDQNCTIQSSKVSREERQKRHEGIVHAVALQRERRVPMALNVQTQSSASPPSPRRSGPHAVATSTDMALKHHPYNSVTATYT